MNLKYIETKIAEAMGVCYTHADTKKTENFFEVRISSNYGKKELSIHDHLGDKFAVTFRANEWETIEEGVKDFCEEKVGK